MKTNYKHFIRYCLVVVSIMALATVIGACSSKPTPTSTIATTSTTTPTTTPISTTAPITTTTTTPIPTTTTAPTLSSITVTPATPANLVMGSSQQFTATGKYTDGSTANITSQVTWTSSNNSIVNIFATGQATNGISQGTANITASLSGVTSPAVPLTVVKAAPVLSSITVTSSLSYVVAGSTQQLTATGTYDDNSTADISSKVKWTSSDTSVVTISSTGLATGFISGFAGAGAYVGTADVTASLSGITSPVFSIKVIMQ